MTAAQDLWASVVANYDSDTLLQLTSINDTTATVASTAIGEAAAQEVIDLWPLHAQSDFDETDTQHLTVGRQGVLAVLYRRGGSSTEAATSKWDEVFGGDGLIVKLRRTRARSRRGPTLSSADGTAATRQGWSDTRSLPVNYLPSSTGED